MAVCPRDKLREFQWTDCALIFLDRSAVDDDIAMIDENNHD